MQRFSDYPTVKVLPRKSGDKIYRLVETLGYRTAVLDDCPNIIIYAGYESDGASVPRFLWVWFPPSGRYTGAAIVHDWLCDTKICTKREASDVFLEAMTDLGCSRAVRYPMYWAVRLFGPKLKDDDDKMDTVCLPT